MDAAPTRGAASTTAFKGMTMTGTALMVQEDARTASRVRVDFQRAVFLMEVVDNGDRARDLAQVLVILDLVPPCIGGAEL